MIHAAVIGHPIAHSKSPLIHRYWMAQHKIAGDYQALDIAPSDLAARVRALADLGFAGFNVTVPHKVTIMDLCDELDDTARAIGAVNTVVIRGGKLLGRNTDAFGFMENLKAAHVPLDWRAPVMVLGAGGAARAVLHALLDEGAQDIRLANRSPEKALALQAMAPERISVAAWEARSALDDCALLVNTTSLGMKGQLPLDMDIARLPKGAIVNDIVYAPLMTDLLQQAQANGHIAVTGIGMLLHQARAAFAAWTGVMPEVDETLAREVLA